MVVHRQAYPSANRALYHDCYLTGESQPLQSQVGRLTALLPPIELAREGLRRRGPTLDEEAVHRMSRQPGAEVLATRAGDSRRFRDGLLPAGQEMAGPHVVAR